MEIRIIPEFTSLSIGLLSVAFILGIKHSVDADHVVAISGMLTRSPSLKRASTLSVAWAMGHMTTAAIITFILFSFKDIFLQPLLTNSELLVALMLIIIAFFTLAWEFDLIKFGKQSHEHGHVHVNGTVHHHETEHQETEQVVKKYEHRHLYIMSFKGEHATMSGIGIIHGLASNDELLLLLTLTLGFSEFFPLLVGVAIFTIGVTLGMIGYATILNYPITKFGHERVTRTLNISIAVVTLFYGIYLLFGGATFNLLPMILD